MQQILSLTVKRVCGDPPVAPNSLKERLETLPGLKLLKEGQLLLLSLTHLNTASVPTNKHGLQGLSPMLKSTLTDASLMLKKFPHLPQSYHILAGSTPLLLWFYILNIICNFCSAQWRAELCPVVITWLLSLLQVLINLVWAILIFCDHKMNHLSRV